jgi:hypothetical protein
VKHFGGQTCFREFLNNNEKKTADASKPEDDDDPNRSPSRNRFFKKEPKAI